VGAEYGACPPPFDCVVKAISVSLADDLPPVPASSFAMGCLAFDLAYGKGLTPFLKVAQSADAGDLADCVGMLVEQEHAFMHGRWLS
jgi:shikimate dehydrogenase